LLDAFTIRERKGKIAGSTSDPGRHPLQPRRALRYLGPDEAGSQSHALRPFNSRAPRLRGNGLPRDAQRSRKPSPMPTSSTSCASSTSASASHVPSLSEYSSLFGLNKARLALTKPTPSSCIPAPSTAGRDRQPNRRLQPLADSPASDERLAFAWQCSSWSMAARALRKSPRNFFAQTSRTRSRERLTARSLLPLFPPPFTDGFARY